MLRKRISIDESGLRGTIFKIADSIDELSKAYRLVHDAYVKKGYMDPDPSGMRVTKHTLNPNTTTFIGLQNKRAISTISLYRDSDSGLPMDVIYKKELDTLRLQGRKIAEVGSLAASPEYWNGNPIATLHSFKIMLDYAMNYLDVDDLVIAVNPKQEHFYTWVMLCHQIGGLKSYNYVKSNPAVAMRLDLDHYENMFINTYSNEPPKKNLHHFLFERKSELICLPDQKAPYRVMDQEKADCFLEMCGTHTAKQRSTDHAK